MRTGNGLERITTTFPDVLETSMVSWKNWDRFTDCPPIGHLLREAERNRWCRFYLLPDGKRTPETSEEISELVIRWNTISSAVLGIGADIEIWKTSFGPQKGAEKEWMSVKSRKKWKENPRFAEDIEDALFQFKTAIWVPGDYDDCIREIEMEEREPIVILAKVSRSVVCPYSGGVDVFLREGSMVEATKTLFSKWRSTMASGL